MVRFCSSLVLVVACVACGSRFSAHDGGGAAGFGNEENGGQPSAAGGSDTGDAGDTSAGGSAGSVNTGGTGAGAGDGGATMGGSGPDDNCTRLKQQYQNALEKARVCEPSSMDQCSPSSTVEALGCGCPVLVNARSQSTSAAKKARQAYFDAKCGEGVACAAIACAEPVSASCAVGIGATGTFVCTAGTAIGR